MACGQARRKVAIVAARLTASSACRGAGRLSSLESTGLILLDPLEKRFLADPSVREEFNELFQDIGACLLPIGSQRFGVNCLVEGEVRRSAWLGRTVKTHSN